MPGDAGRPRSPVYHEIMTTRFTGDRCANGVFQIQIAAATAENTAQIRRIVLAEAHI